MTLLRGLLGGSQGQALGGSLTKTSHSRQSDMLGCQWQLSMQIIKGKMSTYLILLLSNYLILLILLLDCVNLGVRRQLRDCSKSVMLIVFFPDPAFNCRPWFGILRVRGSAFCTFM